MALYEDKTYYLHENLTGWEDLGCRFRAVFEDKAMRFFFDVKDEDVISPFRADNEDLWQADAVEVFLSPDGDLKKYIEMEVSPYGLRFYGEITNKDGKTPVLKKKTPVFTAEATLTKDGYSVEMVLPYDAVKGFDRNKMRLNAFRLDKMADGEQRLYALRATRCGSFHRPEFFL